MTDIMLTAQRINELSELLGNIRFNIELQFAAPVCLNDIRIKVCLRNAEHQQFDMPMDFKPILLGTEDVYHIALPMWVDLVCE